MRAIARKIGVSHVTVSLALRDHPRISPRRVAQIKKVAEELGYRPEPMLYALHSYRTSAASGGHPPPTIAWLDCWHRPGELRRHQEFEGYWRGAHEVLENCGFHLEEFRVDRDTPPRQLETELEAHNTRGLLIPPMPPHQPPILDAWNWREFPVVRFGHSCSRLPVHMVTCDQTSAAHLAFRRVQALGYARIGLVMTDRALQNTLFAAGFLCAQHTIPESLRLPILSLPAAQRRAHPARLKSWLREFQPDAILTGIAELRAQLEAIGKRVPQDIGLAALSVRDGNADAGIDQHPEEIGRVAAETLISLLNSGQRGPAPQRCAVLVSGRWQDGSTLPDRRPAAEPARDSRPVRGHRRKGRKQ